MRIFLLVIVFLAMVHIQWVEASAIPEPCCSVKAEVINTGSEKRRLDSGKEYEHTYIDLRIIEVKAYGVEQSPVSKGQVYRAIDNNPGVFKKGDIIRAGVAPSSAMGPGGPVYGLHWSYPTYEDGSPIINKDGNDRIDFLQSDDKPVDEISEKE